jgi:hypothetical protein
LGFQREQDTSRAVEMPFKDAQAFVYDADTYDFYAIERTLREADPGRIWTFAPKLEASTNYVFVLAEVAGEIEPVVIATPSSPATDAQIVALNAAGGLPAMDIYFARPGVGIAGATPVGTFNALEQIPPRTLPSGDYELFLTAAGNPADVWLSSLNFTLPSNTTSTFIIVPESGQSTARVSALLLQAVPQVLFDRNAPSELRAINGATDQAPRDLAIDSQFSPPLFSAMSFAEPTAYRTVPAGTRTITVTPVGNPGVLELDTPFNIGAGQRLTNLFTGPAGTLLSTFAADDHRRFNREAKVRFMNVATQFLAIDFVVALPDEDPTPLFPLAQLFPPGM